MSPEREEGGPECPKNCPPADRAHETITLPSRKWVPGIHGWPSAILGYVGNYSRLPRKDQKNTEK
jgi:hypothetical protein